MRETEKFLKQIIKRSSDKVSSLDVMNIGDHNKKAIWKILINIDWESKTDWISGKPHILASLSP